MKFCTKCGKELVNGVCSCEATASVNSGVAATTVVTTNNKSAFDVDNIKNIGIKMVKEPEEGLKEFVKEKNFVLSLMIPAAIALFMMILFIIMINDIVGEAPIVSIIINIIILIAVTFGALGSMLFVSLKYIFKDEQADFKKCIAYTCGSYISFVPAMLLTIILYYVAPEYMLYTVYLGALLSNITLITNLNLVTNINNSKKVYAVLISTVVALIIINFVTVDIVVPNILKDMVGGAVNTYFNF